MWLVLWLLLGSMRRSLLDAHKALDTLINDERAVSRLETVASLLATRFKQGSKVLTCGNGGSACDAMHFCEELTGRFRNDRPPLPAIACSDVGHITCTANDYGYEHVFSRWIKALGNEGDVLVVLSTSGNSRNILRAVDAAGEKGLTRVALLGKTGGVLAGLCEHQWVIPGQTADRIQEVHMLILHTLIQGVEQRLFPEQA